MIIINLTGGLGNQMFQYAYGRRLSIDLGVELKYHFVNALFNTPRKFELNIFKTIISEATEFDLKKLGIVRNRYINRLLYLLDDHFKIQFNKNIVTEHSPYIFTTFPRAVSNNKYLQGYFADERYFVKIENILRQEFTPKKKISNVNQKYINDMKESNSVSVHIRRGDYVTNAVNAKLIGFIGLKYYINAINKVKSSVSNPRFYVFSDDITWCRDNLTSLSKDIHFIDHNKEGESYMDITLMSSCKHNIIANSTFSWWGAWLNPNKRKIVISPPNFMRKYA